MQKRIILAAMVTFFLMVSMTRAMEIKLPRTSQESVRDAYEIDLLKLLFKKAGEPCEIIVSEHIFSQMRIIDSLASGTLINLYWMGTSVELEKKLLPVRYPIYRGLLGYRVFIIHKDHQKKFDPIQSLFGLQRLTGAQGRGWSDNRILENAGLKQHQTNYENIFKMINAGNRIDYFSRGVNEAFIEVDVRRDSLPNLAVEKRLLLTYPFCQFFFTSPSRPDIAAVLKKGFEKAYADGSFMTFFSNHPKIKKIFDKANIKDRTRIAIDNPFFSSETAAIPGQYWIQQ